MGDGQPGGSKTPTITQPKTPTTTQQTQPPPHPLLTNATQSQPQRSPRAQMHWVGTSALTYEVGHQAGGLAFSGGGFTLEGSSSGRIG